MSEQNGFAIDFEALSCVMDVAVQLCGSYKNPQVGAATLLLAAAEVSLLITKDHWTFDEPREVMLAKLRKYVQGAAQDMYSEFKSEVVS